MVGAKGFELEDKNAQVLGMQRGYEIGVCRCAQIDSQGIGTGDAELARIVATWSRLPMNVRRAIQTLVEASN